MQNSIQPRLLLIHRDEQRARWNALGQELRGKGWAICPCNIADDIDDVAVRGLVHDERARARRNMERTEEFNTHLHGSPHYLHHALIEAETNIPQASGLGAVVRHVQHRHHSALP